MLIVAEELQLDLKEIRRRREALNLTMEQAADAAGLGSRQGWYNIESGRGGIDVRISTLGRLAKALQCAPDDLLK